MWQPGPLLFPHLSLLPLPCTLHHLSLPGAPPSPPSLTLLPAWLPGRTGAHWFRPPRCTAANCSLPTAEPQRHQQEEQTPLPPPSSVSICLSLPSLCVSVVAFTPLSISQCPVFLLPDHHLLHSLSRSIFLHWNTNFASFFLPSSFHHSKALSVPK